MSLSSIELAEDLVKHGNANGIELRLAGEVVKLNEELKRRPKPKTTTHQERAEAWGKLFEHLYRPVHRFERSEAADAAFNEGIEATIELLATEGLMPKEDTDD